ncbi:hypothetical protein HU200_000558 [Digitaria exilis]|uniref:Uncharacterized protein n=1 Tax=Digitaria exilis TaxID=1010633 RepID=A0A835FZZ0_9POAL|nr:hypothetical protein HU200_000558 [Digitaria exilis]
MSHELPRAASAAPHDVCEAAVLVAAMETTSAAPAASSDSTRRGDTGNNEDDEEPAASSSGHDGSNAQDEEKVPPLSDSEHAVLADGHILDLALMEFTASDFNILNSAFMSLCYQNFQI